MESSEPKKQEVRSASSATEERGKEKRKKYRGKYRGRGRGRGGYRGYRGRGSYRGKRGYRGRGRGRGRGSYRGRGRNYRGKKKFQKDESSKNKTEKNESTTSSQKKDDSSNHTEKKQNKFSRNRSNKFSRNRKKKNFTRQYGAFSRSRRTEPPSPAPTATTTSSFDIATSNQREDLIRAFSKGTVECCICYEIIKETQPIWCCAVCYNVIHFECVREWGGKTGGEFSCPMCSTKYKVPKNNYCFCGKIKDPESTNTLFEIPHSCGNLCERERDYCPHKCTEKCHPGKCPECDGTKTIFCECGKEQYRVPCVDIRKRNCGQVCGKTLSCGKHKCEVICHKGKCEECTKMVEIECFCKKEKSVRVCTKEDGYSCGAICNKVFSCGKHSCQSICHKGDCGICPFSPEIVKTCPCGKTELKVVRKSCEDPIPCCNKTCGKLMSCGKHYCKRKCHTGSCGDICKQKVKIRCRCGKRISTVTCHEANYGDKTKAPFICNKICKTLLNCGRHRCQERCCPGSKNNQFIHICNRVCGRKLNCGVHKCDLPCHFGDCPKCTLTISEPLSCPCGKTKLMPPQLCGTKLPKCDGVCVLKRKCGHPSNHSCHPKNIRCPPCEVLVERTCDGGHTKVIVPCHSKSASCGRVCNKILACGYHICQRVCHPGDCVKGVKVSDSVKKAVERIEELKKKISLKFDQERIEKKKSEKIITKFYVTEDRIKVAIRKKKLIRIKLRKNENNDPEKPISVKFICYEEEKVKGEPVKESFYEMKKEIENLSKVFKPCGKKCGKNKICGHKCLEKCHPGRKCSIKCEQNVEILCQCKRKRTIIKCSEAKKLFEKKYPNRFYKGIYNPTLGECDDECRKIIKNKKWAKILQVDYDKHELPDYDPILKEYAQKDLSFIISLEREFEKLINSTESSKNFKPMKKLKRTIIHYLSDYYNMQSISNDFEPYKFVSVIKLPNSRIPNHEFLLSNVITHPRLLKKLEQKLEEKKLMEEKNNLDLENKHKSNSKKKKKKNNPWVGESDHVKKNLSGNIIENSRSLKLKKFKGQKTKFQNKFDILRKVGK